MDWATHDAPPARRLEPPAPQLVETYWQAVGPSRKELRCGLYRTLAGLELRCGYEIDDLLRSTRIEPQDDARHVAAGWLHIVLSNGSFDVVTCQVSAELDQIRAVPDQPEPPIQ